MNCAAPDPGDMDFCLQCGYYFECDLRDAVPSLALLETSTLDCEVQNM